MNTLSLLTVHYNNLPIIPVDVVCEDYFSHLTTEKFLRKCLLGEIPLPVVRVESSQGVPIKDLAAYIDMRIEAARKELTELLAAQASEAAA
jgi:hypothetical protein